MAESCAQAAVRLPGAARAIGAAQQIARTGFDAAGGLGGGVQRLRVLCSMFVSIRVGARADEVGGGRGYESQAGSMRALSHEGQPLAKALGP